MAKIVLASCQFQIEKRIDKNLGAIVRQMKIAKKRGANLVHFPEACLSGYLGMEVTHVNEAHWDLLGRSMSRIMELARELRLWVVLGCNHRLSGRHKPHNSLYVIDDRGSIVNRFDKLFLATTDGKKGDVQHYSHGEAFVTFEVQHVKCGLLICHDFRYPELFREYKRRGVQLMLASFHNAGMQRAEYDMYMKTVSATLQAAAASNFFTVSATNGTRRYAWPSFVVNAEGCVISRAQPHRPTVLINTIDTNEKLYDASVCWRERCLRGVYHSGPLVKDKRSRDRTCH